MHHSRNTDQSVRPGVCSWGAGAERGGHSPALREAEQVSGMHQALASSLALQRQNQDVHEGQLNLTLPLRLGKWGAVAPRLRGRGKLLCEPRSQLPSSLVTGRTRAQFFGDRQWVPPKGLVFVPPDTASLVTPSRASSPTLPGR